MLPHEHQHQHQHQQHQHQLSTTSRPQDPPPFWRGGPVASLGYFKRPSTDVGRDTSAAPDVSTGPFLVALMAHPPPSSLALSQCMWEPPIQNCLLRPCPAWQRVNNSAPVRGGDWTGGSQNPPPPFRPFGRRKIFSDAFGTGPFRAKVGPKPRNSGAGGQNPPL